MEEGNRIKKFSCLNPRRIVHTLLLLSELILLGTVLYLSFITIENRDDKKISDDEIIIVCSKILTLKSILEKNMETVYPLEYSSEKSLKMNYLYLLTLSNKYKNNPELKKCGILDSFGNIMYIPKSHPCPINEIISNDLNGNNNLNPINENFQSFKFENDILFHSNNSINNEIICKIEKSSGTPKYINENNFVFDYETYEEIENKRKKEEEKKKDLHIMIVIQEEA